MAQIESTRFGSVEVEDDLCYTFPRGLPGFENLHRFVIIEREGQSFKWLQSCEDADVAFLVADPYYFLDEYGADVPPGDQSVLGVRFPEDLAMAVVVTVPTGDPQAFTLNLRAPIVFNIRERIGVQIILTSSRHPVRYSPMSAWAEMKEARESDQPAAVAA